MTDEHRALFERYVAELRQAREVAIRWWEALELNRRLARPQRVSLHRFAIDLLDSRRSEDVSDFLQLSYWPLGFDDSEENLI
jgi:hypothetical protein